MKREKEEGIALGALSGVSPTTCSSILKCGFCLLCFRLPLDGAVAGQEMT